MDVSKDTLKLSSVNLQTFDYWGPPQNFIFEQYKNLPFAPFSKLEKISKACDFTSVAGKGPNAVPSGPSKVQQEDEEAEFTLVESQTAVKKPLYGQYRKKTNYPLQRPQQTNMKQRIVPVSKAQNMKSYMYQRVMTTKTKFKDNAGVQTDWVYINDAGKSNFEKTPVGSVTVKEILAIGSLKEYEKSLETRAAPKKEQPLVTSQNAITLRYGLTDDKVFLDLIEADTGIADATVYTTDAVLSAILTVKNSVFPWDVRVTKINNQIIFDQSEKERTSYIDMLTVNENTSGNLPEEEKDLIRLCVEATNINKNFIYQVAKGEEKNWNNPKYDDEDLPEKKLYKYRKWVLENKFNIIVRSEIDSFIKKVDPENEANETIQYLKIAALNEFDLSADWRAKLETSRGALISSEFRNNSCKISKWLCQAILADVDTVKVGFVSRVAPKDFTKHSVLLVETMKTQQLTQTIGYKLKDNWSIMKHLIETIQKQEDGIYALVKLPYKQSIRIYRIPKEDEASA